MIELLLRGECAEIQRESLIQLYGDLRVIESYSGFLENVENGDRMGWSNGWKTTTLENYQEGIKTCSDLVEQFEKEAGVSAIADVPERIMKNKEYLDRNGGHNFFIQKYVESIRAKVEKDRKEIGVTLSLFQKRYDQTVKPLIDALDRNKRPFWRHYLAECGDGLIPELRQVGITLEE